MSFGNTPTDPRHIYTTTCGGEAQGDWIILTASHIVCTLCNTHTSDFSEKNRSVSASGAISDIRQLGVAKEFMSTWLSLGTCQLPYGHAFLLAKS